ncbi:MAG: hypothetical protein JWR69_1225 [Pedosphaera sp.]|nr:hypothetical protein [Pedosphaera sp.]
MSRIFDEPTIGVIVVILACIVLFVPTFVAHYRRIHAFQSVSALNALTMLLVVCTLVSPWFFCGAVVVWAAAAIWSAGGRRTATNNNRNLDNPKRS